MKTITKLEALDILTNGNKKKALKLSAQLWVYNLIEFEKVLSLMDVNVYEHFTSKKINLFIYWLSFGIRDPELAHQLEKASIKDEALKIVRTRVKELQKICKGKPLKKLARSAAKTSRTKKFASVFSRSKRVPKAVVKRDRKVVRKVKKEAVKEQPEPVQVARDEEAAVPSVESSESTADISNSTQGDTDDELGVKIMQAYTNSGRKDRIYYIISCVVLFLLGIIGGGSITYLALTINLI